MKTFLKNYTSDVPVSQTIYRIEQVLLRCGVRGIMKEYGIDQSVSAITFKLEVEGKPVGIRLPVNEAQATDILWKEYAGEDYDEERDSIVRHRANLKKKRRADFAEQGARTAWRIVQDWVEVQMSMVQTGQAEMMEVFLPYVFNGKQTYYTAIKESKFAGLLTQGEK